MDSLPSGSCCNTRGLEGVPSNPSCSPSCWWAFVHSAGTLHKYPELNEVFDLLAGKFDDTMMQSPNYKIDVENKTPEEVAKVFLTEQGLLK